LYQSDIITRDKDEDTAANQEEVAASCGHFSYSLEEFGREMEVFLDILKQMQAYQDQPTKSWNWLKFWKKNKKSTGSNEAMTRSGYIDDLPSEFPQEPPTKRRVPNVSYGDTVPFTYRIWKGLKGLRRDSVKFSLKTGLGAALYALPAFIPASRPFFSHWRLEWGLVSYMIVMSMTLGATNTSGLYRVIGTLIGASLTVLAWILFPGNAPALAAFGWLISLPCFSLIVNSSKVTLGRFTLLTYNISALYAYSLSVRDGEGDGDEGGVNPIITEIVWHRVVAVLAGVVWGLFVNRYIWPISARSKIRVGLSILWLRMALIWKRDPLNSLIEGESEMTYLNISQELVLQKTLFQLQDLLSQVPYEFRLKGPFPVNEYKDILILTQAMLDAFHGMNVIISKDKATRGETEILDHTANERADLCSKIFHMFWIISSSIRSGFPMPDSLPSTERARDRLLTKLHKYRQRIRGSEGQNDADFALLYAYGRSCL